MAFSMLIFSCLRPYNVFSVAFGMQYRQVKYAGMLQTILSNNVKCFSTADYNAHHLSFDTLQK